jgi:MtN3 and saliva related transmembrane protein
MHLIGFLAGALTTAAFVPQVLKSWRTRSVDDLSISMLLMFNLGVVLWIAYGWMVGAMPVVAANLVTLLLTISLLFLKVSASSPS